MTQKEIKMFCPMCGAPNEEDDEFCGNCGAALQPPSGDVPVETKAQAAGETAAMAARAEPVEVAGDEIDEVKAAQETLAEPAPAEIAPARVPAGRPEPPPPLPRPAYRPAPAKAAASVPTSGLAIASLVMGIGGLTILPLVGSILAIVFGYMARRDIRQRPGELAGDGIALAGIVMGWIAVGLAVLGLLFGIGIGICGLCGALGSGNF
jgi:Domain of unknown function (DUF4190)/zinc-ribbon domain